MKRSLFSLFLAVLLIVSFAVLSPAVYAAESEASAVSEETPVTYSSNLTVTLDCTYFPDFEAFELRPPVNSYWSLYVQSSPNEYAYEYFYTDESNRVYYYCTTYGSFRVVDAAGNWQLTTFEMKSQKYYLQPLMHFEIEEHYKEAPSGVEYLVQITLLGSPSFKLQDLIDHKVIMYNQQLGDCRFVLLHNGEVALRVGIQPSGSGDSIFEAQYRLTRTDLTPFCDPALYLSDTGFSKLYAFDVCKTLELHNWKFLSYVTAPTCTEKGESIQMCSYCGKSAKKEETALGHNRNFLGVCQRDGCDASTIIGDIVDNITGGGADNSGGDSGNTDGGAGGGAGNGSEGSSGGGGNWFTNIFTGNAGGGFSGTLNSITKLLGVILIFVLVVVLIPVLKPLLQALVDMIKALIGSISSGAKKLSKWAKSKKKAKKNKEKKDKND